MMRVNTVFLLCRQKHFRQFSVTKRPWEHCSNVTQLIGAMKDVQELDKAAQESMETKAMQLLSDNLKEAAMLLITLKNFGCDVTKLTPNIKVTRHDENLDLWFRALAECGVKAPPLAEEEIMAATKQAESPRHLYNYLCGASRYNSTAAVADIQSLVVSMENIGLHSFTPLQLLHIAHGLAEIDHSKYSDTLDQLCTELVQRGLGDMELSDLLEGIAKLSRNYQSSELLSALEQTLLANYGARSLTPEEICLAIYTFSRYFRCNNLVMDKLAVNLRRGIGNFDLPQLTKVLIGLSKVGYYNKAIVILLGRMVRTFLDRDSTADPQLLTNLYTGFSRFLYSDKLFDLFSTIIRKEEVFADLQKTDAVAIVQAYARVHQQDQRLFTLFDTKLFSSPLNTTLSVKLLVAHGKLRYRNPRLQNALLNNINLQELDSEINREKLKLAVERLSLFYPEITGEQDTELPTITWRRLDPERRRMQHVRRRKWTW